MVNQNSYDDIAQGNNGVKQLRLSLLYVHNISPKRNNIENIVVLLYHPLYTRSD